MGHSDLIWTNSKLDPLGILQNKYEWFLISGFIEDFLRIGQIIAQNYPLFHEK